MMKEFSDQYIQDSNTPICEVYCNITSMIIYLSNLDIKQLISKDNGKEYLATVRIRDFSDRVYEYPDFISDGKSANTIGTKYDIFAGFSRHESGSHMRSIRLQDETGHLSYDLMKK